MILVGLMVPDLRPGQHLFTEQIDKVCAIFGAMLIANVMFLALGLFAAKLFARVTLAPRGILWPILFPFIVLGAYSLAQSMLDVYITLTFCVVGYLSRRFGFAVAPAVIGLILGEMVETKLQNSLKISDGDWTQILLQPLAAFFLILALLGNSQPYIVGYLRKLKANFAQS